MTGADLNAGIGRETAERCLKYPVILVVQDTSAVARATPEAPALQVLQTEEVEALVAHFDKKKRLRAEHVTIRQATLWIARLGGHLNRKGDGMPGVRTLWRGLQALSLLVAGIRAGQQLRESMG